MSEFKSKAIFEFSDKLGRLHSLIAKNKRHLTSFKLKSFGFLRKIARGEITDKNVISQYFSKLDGIYDQISKNVEKRRIFLASREKWIEEKETLYRKQYEESLQNRTDILNKFDTKMKKEGWTRLYNQKKLVEHADGFCIHFCYLNPVDFRNRCGYSLYDFISQIETEKGRYELFTYAMKCDKDESPCYELDPEISEEKLKDVGISFTCRYLE